MGTTRACVDTLGIHLVQTIEKGAQGRSQPARAGCEEMGQGEIERRSPIACKADILFEETLRQKTLVNIIYPSSSGADSAAFASCPATGSPGMVCVCVCVA